MCNSFEGVLTWRLLLEQYILPAISFGDADAGEKAIIKIKSSTNVSGKQTAMLRKCLSIMHDSAYKNSPDWIRYLISVFSFNLQYPDGTRDNCTMAKSFAAHLLQKYGALPLLLFYEVLLESGYPESEIHEVLVCSEGGL